MTKKKEIVELLGKDFPQLIESIEEATNGSATLRQMPEKKHLRPGGTVSGPTLMALADVAMYIAILSQTTKAYHAVTTNLNINFLRKPPGNQAIIGKSTIVKFGKTLTIAEVTIYSEGIEQPIAHATATYAMLQD